MPRMLCFQCWQKRSVRDRYPPTLLEPSDADLTRAPEPGKQPRPTDAPPGSVRKMFVFRQRLRNREPLVHPDDESCRDTDSAATDRAFLVGESAGNDGFREMLAAARKTRRVRPAHAPKVPARRHGRAFHECETRPLEPGWLDRELEAFRARQAAAATLTFPAELLQPRPGLQPAAAAG